MNMVVCIDCGRWTWFACIQSAGWVEHIYHKGEHPWSTWYCSDKCCTNHLTRTGMDQSAITDVIRKSMDGIARQIVTNTLKGDS